MRLRPGDALQVQCLAHGSHPIQFVWSRVGRPNLPSAAETTKDGKLLIPRVKLNDSGTYKCEATSEYFETPVFQTEGISVTNGTDSSCTDSPTYSQELLSQQNLD